MYNMMGNMPGGYYNPMMNAQQRLAQMEQQYSQLAQQNQPYHPMNQPTLQQPGFLKGRAVTSIDEAKAALIDLDGTPNIFTDFANGNIYVKYTNLNGTASLDIYRKETISMMQPNVDKEDGQNEILGLIVDELDKLNKKYSDLINLYSGGMKNDGSNAKPHANDDATTSKGPTISKGAANG